MAVARTAAAHGARILTYSEVTGLREDGVDAVDGADRRARSRVRARHMIVAAGVWTSALTDAVTLRPSRGSHLLVRAERLGDPRAIVNVKVPGERGRWVFAIPRGDGLVAIGLTDVDAAGRSRRRAGARRRRGGRAARTARRRRSTCRSAPATWPAATPGCGRWPPGRARPADLSRRHAIVEDPDTGALAIVGGKLTTYRRMAQDVVDRITDRPCRTARLPLVGAAAPAALGSVAAPSGSSAATGPRRRPSSRSPTGARSCSSRWATACRSAAPSCCGPCATSSR